MDLVSFLGWENSHGVYRSKVDEKIYRIVDNKLEVYKSHSSRWENCNMPINQYYKLKHVQKVGIWSEGFEIHNEEEWQLVKTYYLQNGYGMPDGTVFSAERYIENHVAFYVWLHYGKVQITTNKEWAKRDLILKPINWEPKYHAVYAGKADFGTPMCWQINSNRCTVSLVENNKVENWHSMGMLSTLKAWRRCGVAEENAVFIPYRWWQSKVNI